jgi:hypothetical protein
VAASDPRETEIAARLSDAVVCVRCGGSSGLDWRGWLAYRVEDGTGGPPELGFFCPACAGAKKAIDR